MSSIATRITIFLLLSLFFTLISWRALKNPYSHGFYRFFAFEGIAALVLYNHPMWFEQPFSVRQSVSWLLLLGSVFLVSRGLYLLKCLGGHSRRQTVPENLSFENTQNLVEEGMYRYIRHPMYSSLLLLGWGAFLKQINGATVILVATVTLALFLTAKVEESENISFFGAAYRDYLHRSKMFIPFIF